MTDLCGRMAALHTSTSIAPEYREPSFTMRLDRVGIADVAEHRRGAHPALAALLATASSSSRLERVLSTRSAPSAAKASAMARPMLRLAPVTKAVRP